MKKKKSASAVEQQTARPPEIAQPTRTEPTRPAARRSPGLSGAPATPEPAKKAPRIMKETSAKGYAVIDYPQEGEIVTSPYYTFRIGASPTDRVEVSIDGKEWLACRPHSGYWWYDWSGYNAGPHRLTARIPTGPKSALKSKLRQFTVLI